MDIKLDAIITTLILFLLSLFIDGVRSFLLKLPGKILKYFRDKNFKHYILFFNDTKDIKELGKYCFCSFDNKTYIMNSIFLPSETVENKPSANLHISSQKTETTEQETKEESEFRISQEQNLTNNQMIEVLDKFFRINEDKRQCFLSETVYMSIKDKLQKRKINLVICVNNERFKKFPFKNLSERDFNCSDSKLSIELKL